MKLSLSVRIVEAPCKTKLNIPFEDIVAVARDTGYQALCMRSSAGGVGTPLSRLVEMRRIIEDAGLHVSMVTADSDVPLNNDHGPDALRNIGPSLDVAEAFGCNLLRVCLKTREDIPYAQAAADEAARRGIRFAHQCHTATIFEEVGPALDVLAEIGRPNFGLTYEPANLLVCGQSYKVDTLLRLSPHILNVYVQNHRLDPNGPACLDTYCKGRVRFHHIDPWDSIPGSPNDVDFHAVANGLQTIGYNGYFTIHQAQGIQTAADASAFAARCAGYFKTLFAM